MNAQNRARAKLIGIFSIFLAPLALAFVLYYGFSYSGGRGTNSGELIDPARPLPKFALHDKRQQSVPNVRVLRRKWTLLEVAPAGCRQACRASLDKTRQVRALLHDDIHRVQRVLLVGADQSWPRPDKQPDLHIYRTHLTPLMNLFTDAGANTPGAVYVIDPLGNWMLYYPRSVSGDGLFEDIKHLLKFSHIG